MAVVRGIGHDAGRGASVPGGLVRKGDLVGDVAVRVVGELRQAAGAVHAEKKAPETVVGVLSRGITAARSRCEQRLLAQWQCMRQGGKRRRRDLVCIGLRLDEATVGVVLVAGEAAIRPDRARQPALRVVDVSPRMAQCVHAVDESTLGIVLVGRRAIAGRVRQRGHERGQCRIAASRHGRDVRLRPGQIPLANAGTREDAVERGL